MYKKVVISKEGEEPIKLQYEVIKPIENDEYEELLNKFTPTYEFSIVDKIIQELSDDIIPSFKKSSLFTNDDLEEIVRPFKNNYILKIEKKSKNKSKYFVPKTKKNNKKNNKKNKKKNNKKNQKPKKTRTNKKQ
tara:strand:- start:1859 stop:2260 length:402 start_codon:yes stop_codon:yes gene_type:complete